MTEQEKKEMYVVLKIFEGLVKEGVVEEAVFRGILQEYSDEIDVSGFSCYSK